MPNLLNQWIKLKSQEWIECDRISLPSASVLRPCGAAGAMLVVLISSCGEPHTISLASGTEGGFYSRLGEQVSLSTQKTAGISVQNRPSQGSRENLERLIQGEVDFALVQLDVAREALQTRQVLAVAALAQEDVHIVVWRDSGVQTLSDLQGRRVAVGAPGSGIRHTTDQLAQASQLTFQNDDSAFDEAFEQLQARQVDAVIYVGSVGASQKLQQQFLDHPQYTLAAISPSVTNHLTIRYPGSYQPTTLPPGAYAVLPATPERDVSTLATATVLVTRPNVNRRAVGLVTWSVLADARAYAQFYPALLEGEAAAALRRGLLYLHPAAEEVYENGDPRAVLARYWNNNDDLQAGVFLLGGTTAIGLLLRYWRKRQSHKTVIATSDRINELRQLLPDYPQQALSGIEDLSQENRLRFIDGAVTPEIYEQLRHKTQTFTDQCRSQLDEQRTQFVRDTLLLLDEWQATLQSNPTVALQKLSQIKHQYREMLLAGQVDIKAYIELVQLTLMSVMTLVPTAQAERTQGCEEAVTGGRVDVEKQES
ncbi:TAXI family TRAP transporter solute-binding subunit [Pseudanabaena sp. FACHB-2040]|uniref:TAXI family TRAP transporter solute-binding subunit n=1 Tax=Pseudanabaena sp. FACHB-2040 TaxID=2692859 RepID=UPI0016844B37|nr:TAXI family TRAP transporter solute-binding subunit [Pseudanabaena sp. FACHB-2040]MBD2258320.1 TAXI family TRAP transporter solute-binding subunit [Pseudanabaena sp. FACHB-2040]